jgi:hypothetical protein
MHRSWERQMGYAHLEQIPTTIPANTSKQKISIVRRSHRGQLASTYWGAPTGPSDSK